jgi:hypothetical protein
MLAQNFMTPTDLGLSDVEFESLVKVLGMLERGELKDAQHLVPFTKKRIENGFDMSYIHRRSCGTVGCIMGWCQIVASDDALFHRLELNDVCRSANRQLGNLFLFGDSRRHDARVSHAAIALRNYLTFGEPRWDEALCD